MCSDNILEVEAKLEVEVGVEVEGGRFLGEFRNERKGMGSRKICPG
jgi:hypothetical protein